MKVFEADRAEELDPTSKEARVIRFAAEAAKLIWVLGRIGKGLAKNQPERYDLDDPLMGTVEMMMVDVGDSADPERGGVEIAKDQLAKDIDQVTMALAGEELIGEVRNVIAAQKEV